MVAITNILLIEYFSGAVSAFAIAPFSTVALGMGNQWIDMEQ